MSPTVGSSWLYFIMLLHNIMSEATEERNAVDRHETPVTIMIEPSRPSVTDSSNCLLRLGAKRILFGVREVS